MHTTTGTHLKKNALLLSIASAAFLIEFIPNLYGGYGYFIDEFYYVACAKRLALGYVDHPPLAPLVLRICSWLFGFSIPAIRLLPAMAGAATVVVTILMVRRLGGGRFAELIAGLATLSAPVFLVIFGMFSMNCFEILLWAGCAWVVIVLIQDDRPRLWIVLGLLAGLGFENKHTMILLMAGLLVGILLTSARVYVFSKWFWAGLGLAALIALPNLIWQAMNEWPSIEFYRMATFYKNIPTPPLKGLANQILFANPATLPVWGGGLYYFLISKQGKTQRIIGWTFLTMLILTLAAKSSRPDRLAGGYPMMFAGGAVFIEALTRSHAGRWMRWALVALVLTGGAALAPLGIPILHPERLAAYSATIGIVPQLERGRGKTAPLPQWFADRFGWEEMVAKVAEIYQRLPAGDKARATIFAPSYGHAGAIELFGPAYHLPQVLSGQNTYWLWGKGADFRGVAIIIGGDSRRLREFYGRVESAGVYNCDYCMRWRDNMPIYIARDPKFAMRDAWPLMKHFE
jgi:hypothetical protein